MIRILTSYNQSTTDEERKRLSEDLMKALPEKYNPYMLDHMHEAFNPLIVHANGDVSYIAIC